MDRQEFERIKNAQMREMLDIIPIAKPRGYQGDTTSSGMVINGSPTKAWAVFSRDKKLQEFDEAACRKAIDSGDTYAVVVTGILDAERERILAKLETLRPMEQPYTRREWALGQRGEKSMFDKIMRAIAEGGE